jgi:hypothetical protein
MANAYTYGRCRVAKVGLVGWLDMIGGGAMLLGSSSSPRCKQMNSDIEFCELLRPTLGLGILGGTEPGCLGDLKVVVDFESCDFDSARKQLIFATLALFIWVYLRNASSISASGWSSRTFLPFVVSDQVGHYARSEGFVHDFSLCGVDSLEGLIAAQAKAARRSRSRER